MQNIKTRPINRRSPLFVLGLTLFWLLLGFYTLILTIHHYSFISQSPTNLYTFWDFKLFYMGSLDFLNGGTLYRPNATLPFERVIDKNGNSPVGALVFLPLAQLPLALAAALWVILSLALFYWGLSYVWRIYKLPRQLQWRILIVLVIYLTFPVVDVLQLGTWGLVIAFLDFSAWYYARKGNDRVAGILLGLAMSIRWQPFVLFLLFLLLRRYRLILHSILTIAVAYLLALFVFGLNNFVDFANIVFKLGDQKLTAGYDSSLRAFLGRIFDALSSSIGLNLNSYLFLTWLVVAFGMLGLTLWHCRKLSYDYAYSLCLVYGLLLAPSGWMHYHMALLLPVTLLVVHRQFWPVIYIALLWFIPVILFPFGINLDFEANPLLFGSLLSLGLFWLYYSLFQGPLHNLKSERPDYSRQ